MESIEKACEEPISYTCQLMCENQLEIMLQTIKGRYPKYSFTSKKAKMKKGPFKGVPLYQVKRGWGFFGRLFGRVVAEFSARNPRNLLTCDIPICDILYEELPKELKIKRVFYSYKP